MDYKEEIFNKIAEALLIDYTSVYYVNAVTNEYQWYSINAEFHSLEIEPSGKDFFKNMARDAEQVVYEEDKHIFQNDIQKEHLTQQLKDGSMRSIEYRLMIDGKPVWHRLRMIKEASDTDDYFILGVLNVDKEIRMREEAEKLETEREIFNQIAGSLAEHYDTLYYIDMETNHYFEFSSTDIYKSLNIPTRGDDFFAESAKNIPLAVYPEDKDLVLGIHQKQNMLKNLKEKISCSYTYRLIVNGEMMHCRNMQMWASDHKHLIVCIENINAEVIAEQAFQESQKNSITYSAIAETLAARYDIIYYVDIESDNYAVFTTNNIYGNLEMQEEGHSFFADAQNNAEHSVYPEDKDRVLAVLTKDYLLSSLEDVKQYSTDYRLMIDGKPQYTRLTVMFSSDHIHFIIGVENITEEIRKEEEHLHALRIANEMARRDELTGAKNKNAYRELESDIQERIDAKESDHPFAIVVCDLNNLKLINDTLGHKAGDEYIQSSCKLIFDTFAHSPVYRIGGDEFAAVLNGRDYADRDQLFETLRNQVLMNRREGGKPVIASGMAVYDLKTDRKVSDVFERADNMMYQNKRLLKEMTD